MANCTQCGTALSDGLRFCTACGAAVPVRQTAPPPEMSTAFRQAQPQYDNRQAAPRRTPQSIYRKPPYTPPRSDAPPAGSKYELITTSGYIGILLLMCIPVVGIVLALIWAFGGCQKLQKRNLARAMLILMSVGLVFSLIFGAIFRRIANDALENTGLAHGSNSIGQYGDSKKEQDAGGLLGMIGAIDGKKENSAGGELGELQDVLHQLEELTGEDTGFDDLVDEIGEINEEASQHASGWPSDLPKFPAGTMQQVETYRTEYHDTTPDDMKAYIETLKEQGFTFQDFYGFGLSEESMLGSGGWWGYNGKWYLSVSHTGGITLIDHVTELPDLSSLLG